MYLDRLLKNTDDFYRQTLTTLLAERQLGATDRILVVCGGQHDRDVLHRLGFTRVTLSNLDTRMEADAFAPFEWSFPAQSNGFAVFIQKPSLPRDLYPWLSLDGQQQVALNHSWLNQRYRR